MAMPVPNVRTIREIDGSELNKIIKVLGDRIKFIEIDHTYGPKYAIVMIDAVLYRGEFKSNKPELHIHNMLFEGKLREVRNIKITYNRYEDWYT